MRRFLSFVILLSVLVIQLHGLAHSDVNQNDENHSCAI